MSRWVVRSRRVRARRCLTGGGCICQPSSLRGCRRCTGRCRGGSLGGIAWRSIAVDPYGKCYMGALAVRISSRRRSFRAGLGRGRVRWRSWFMGPMVVAIGRLGMHPREGCGAGGLIARAPSDGSVGVLAVVSPRCRSRHRGGGLLLGCLVGEGVTLVQLGVLLGVGGGVDRARPRGDAGLSWRR